MGLKRTDGFRADAVLIARGIPLFPNGIETASAAFGRTLTLADPGIAWVISCGVVLADISNGLLVHLDIGTGPMVGAVGVMSLAGAVPTAAVCDLSLGTPGGAAMWKHKLRSGQRIASRFR